MDIGSTEQWIDVSGPKLSKGARKRVTDKAILDQLNNIDHKNLNLGGKMLILLNKHSCLKCHSF
jgi:hypothetical protein